MSMTIGGKQVASITIGGKTVSTIGIGGKIVEIASAAPNYFYVQAEAAGAQVWLQNVSNTPSIEYSTDGTTWTSWDYSRITLANIGDKVYFRGNNPNGFITSSSNSSSFKCTADYRVGGDIAYLVSTTGSAATLPASCFRALFNSQEHLIDASNLILSATSVGDYCYYMMFNYCTALTAAPVISATSVGDSSFQSMFYGCTSLTESPTIHAAPTVTNSFVYMFYGCTALSKVTYDASSWNSANATSWMHNVAATGDFYNLGGATFESGSNGIPTGWTEHTSL